MEIYEEEDSSNTGATESEVCNRLFLSLSLEVYAQQYPSPECECVFNPDIRLSCTCAFLVGKIDLHGSYIAILNDTRINVEYWTDASSSPRLHSNTVPTQHPQVSAEIVSTRR
jgi:hypothetical protein